MAASRNSLSPEAQRLVNDLLRMTRRVDDLRSIVTDALRRLEDGDVALAVEMLKAGLNASYKR